MEGTLDNWDQRFRNYSSGFSIELNGHGVIVDGVRGLYFSPIFRRCKIIPWNKKIKTRIR